LRSGAAAARGRGGRAPRTGRAAVRRRRPRRLVGRPAPPPGRAAGPRAGAGRRGGQRRAGGGPRGALRPGARWRRAARRRGPGVRPEQGRPLRLDIPSFACVLRRLVLGPAHRPAAVRALLNLALPAVEGAPPVPLAPEEGAGAEGTLVEGPCRQKRAPGAATSATGDGGDGEVSEGGAEDIEWPEELVFRGCSSWPELNGCFRRTRDFDQLLQERRPTYERADVAGGPGGGCLRVFCFFWLFRAADGEAPADGPGARRKAKRRGAPREGAPGGGAAPERGRWWLGTQVGGEKGLLGECRCDSELPPGEGWLLRPPASEGGREEGPGGFVRPEDLGAEALRRLDLAALAGHVRGPTPEVAAYFGHFCTLLHLE
ncbi:unnamed protein product, partial [Prorocentrum cordatum]